VTIRSPGRCDKSVETLQLGAEAVALSSLLAQFVGVVIT
jgi:hypothetical protein